MAADLYAYDIVQHAVDVDVDAWQTARRHTKNAFLDLRYLQAVEIAFANEAQLWYVIIRSDSGQPIACTCFSSYLVDGALMAPPAFQKGAAAIRRVWPSFLKYKILLCGVPASTCSSQLAIADDAELERVLHTLDTIALNLARESGCNLISFKEFSPEFTRKIDALKQHGFLWARSLVAYSLNGEFESFDQYFSSRSKTRRRKIRKHFQKFEEAGLTCEELRGRDGVELLMTDAVHGLYLNVLNRAQVKFEQLPVAFFQELAKQLPDDSCFTIVRKGERIVGFCCGLAAENEHNMLFCGLDYSLNSDADLYFNIIYRGLRQGIVPGVQVVHVGAGADVFKERMGCDGESLSIYVKAVGTFRQFLLRQVFGLLFDTRPEVPALPCESENESETPRHLRRSA